MAVDLVTLGRRLKEARDNRDLSQEEVARRLEISRPQLIQIEAGKKDIDLRLLDRFAELYGRTASGFLAEFAEDALTALLRATPEVGDSTSTEAEIMRHVSICRAGAELERLLGREVSIGPPAYDVPAPSTPGEAVEQGAYTARQERGRLGLGDNTIPDMADVIASTGVWASGSRFPDEISGLFLRDQSIGMVVLVNYEHSRTRKRFSYAHEFAHVLHDRSQTATISTQRNRRDLTEVRANAFAAAFLMPSTGVRRYLQGRRKGLRSRTEMLVYDLSVDAEQPEESVRAMSRTIPGSQKVTYQDVAAMAHVFGTSYQAAAYRLRGMNLINQVELEELLEKESFGHQYLRILHLNDETDSVSDSDSVAGDRELIGQVLDLAIEAYRRELIGRDRLLELGATLGIGGQTLVSLAEAA